MGLSTDRILSILILFMVQHPDFHGLPAANKYTRGIYGSFSQNPVELSMEFPSVSDVFRLSKLFLFTNSFQNNVNSCLHSDLV